MIPIVQIAINNASSFGLTACFNKNNEGKLRVVTAIIKLSTVPSCAFFAGKASATGIVPKISAYIGIPTSGASTTPRGLLLPSIFSTQTCGIQLCIIAPTPTPSTMYGKTFLKLKAFALLQNGIFSLPSLFQIPGLQHEPAL